MEQQPGIVTHSCISSLLISRHLTRPRVASRYSVRTSSDRKWVWQPKSLGRTTSLSTFLNLPLSRINQVDAW